MPWQGELKTVPPEARKLPPKERPAVMEQRYGKNVPRFLPPGFGTHMRERRRLGVFPKLDKLPSPPPGDQIKGLKVYDGGRHGRANGTTHACPRKGCGYRRLTVVWPDGLMTHPCETQLVVHEDGRRVADHGDAKKDNP
jgi:hypothetical protein